jgi:hypothetical protein
MMSDRIIELALETLEARKAALQAEIDQLRAQLKSVDGAEKIAAKPAPVAKKGPRGRRGPRSAAARKAQSARMKEFWARRKAEAAGKSSAKAPAGAKKSGKE